MVIDDFISQIEEMLKISSDDSDITRDYIWDIIDQNRALQIRRELEKGVRTWDDTVVQELPCVELELVSSSICSNVGLPDCMILRTKDRIPDPIELKQRDGIVSIGSPLITKSRFNYIDISMVPNAGSSSMMKNSIYAFILDGHIYLYRKQGLPELEYIWIRGVFEKPAQAMRFKRSLEIDSPCFDPTIDDYPISLWMWQQYIKPATFQDIAQKFSIPDDQENDSRDNRNDNVATGRKE